MKNRWKQVIACHVTRKESISSDILKFHAGLYHNSRVMWTSLNIHSRRNGVCRNYFNHNGHDIFVIPDPCHLLKNLKGAMFRQEMYLPEAFVEQEKLPTVVVNGSFIKTLWKYEISHELEKRLLHHLRREDIDPTNFEKMNVGAAVRFFSSKTSSALKTAVELDILPHEALTTAHFKSIIHGWFSLLSSKVRKTSIIT